MERDHHADTHIVDLGQATAETRGGEGKYTDEVLFQAAAGLSDA